jgi:hypothetical protein
MVFHAILPKIAVHWIINFYRAAKKLRSNAFQYYRNSTARATAAAASRCTIPSAADRTVVCDFHGGLLRSTTLFPYFMLVACEGGSLLRALLLLCSYPLVWALGEHADAGIRVMAFVTFVGLRPRDADLVARAILPKFYMERLNALVYDHLWLPAGRKVAVTSAPRVMAEWFLKEYMAADVVVGRELQTVQIGRGCYFTGLLRGPGAGPEVLGGEGDMADVFVVGASNPLNHLFIPGCKVRSTFVFVHFFKKKNSRAFNCFQLRRVSWSTGSTWDFTAALTIVYLWLLLHQRMEIFSSYEGEGYRELLARVRERNERMFCLYHHHKYFHSFKEMSRETWFSTVLHYSFGRKIRYRTCAASKWKVC